MPEAFICDAVRTPIGRYAGGLAKVRTDDLAAVPLKYPGLAAWEIWLSEAQERMVLAVPPTAARVRPSPRSRSPRATRKRTSTTSAR